MRLWPLWVCLGLAGCMPPGDFRPASGFIEDRRTEVGGGAVGVGKRPYVDEPTRAVGQLWVNRLLGKRWTVSGVGAFDDNAVAVGGALRYDYLRLDRLALGAEVQAGYAWGAVTLPAAVRIFDQTWIYTSPRVAPRFQEWLLDIPAGISVRVYDGLMLRLEYHVTWIDLDYFSKRNLLGFGAAYQF